MNELMGDVHILADHVMSSLGHHTVIGPGTIALDYDFQSL